MSAALKAKRQQAILDLVARERLSSQEEIRARLAYLGMEATQSTISRDVEELGLARVHDGGGVRYVARGASGSYGPMALLRHLLDEFALSFVRTDGGLVVRTSPGAAAALAEGLDRAGLPDVAGTIAGDNTILIARPRGREARPRWNGPSPISWRPHDEREGGAGLQRRAGHVGHDPVARRAGLRGARGRGGRRPAGGLRADRRRGASWPGAASVRVVDAVDRFASEYLTKAIKANGLYEGKYPMVSGLARPLIADEVVKVARELDASTLAHGCTGKGNDQVRFEVSFAALAPDLKVLAPIRDAGIPRDKAHRARRRVGHPDHERRDSRTPSTRTSGAAPPSAARSRIRGSPRPRTRSRGRRPRASARASRPRSS